MTKLFLLSSLTALLSALPGPPATAAPDKPGPVPALEPAQAEADAKNPAKEGKSGDPTAPGRESKPRQLTEEEFVQHSIRSAQLNIRLATLATTRAQADEVMSFAETLVKDYSTSLTLLRATALRANLALGADPDPKAQETYDKLSGLKHNEFDSAFLNEIALNHKTDLAFHESGRKGGMSDFVMQYVQAHVTVLKRHAATLAKMEPHHGGGEIKPGEDKLEGAAPSSAPAAAPLVAPPAR